MVEHVTILQLPQDCETPVSEQRRSRFTYRYAYERSADSQAGSDHGQDYLTLHEDGSCFAFALCDGVSQSFMGNVAARILGDTLVAWFWQSLAWDFDQAVLQRHLYARLCELTAPASAEVRATLLPPDLPDMLRDVLEQKRQIGSQSTFVAGVLDTRTDRLRLAWMGDSRLRLWGEHGECLGRESFKTSERWSTREGPIGELHTLVLPLHEIRCLLAYSDGLAGLDGVAESLSDAAVMQLIAQARSEPSSDDISFLEITNIKPDAAAKQRQSQLSPPPEPGPGTAPGPTTVKAGEALNSQAAVVAAQIEPQTKVGSTVRPLRPRGVTTSGLPVRLLPLAAILVLAIGLAVVTLGGDKVIRFPEDGNTQLVIRQVNGFTYRYAYQRSAATVPGTYLRVREEGGRLVFMLFSDPRPERLGSTVLSEGCDPILDVLWASTLPQIDQTQLQDCRSLVTQSGLSAGIIDSQQQRLSLVVGSATHVKLKTRDGEIVLSEIPALSGSLSEIERVVLYSTGLAGVLDRSSIPDDAGLKTLMAQQAASNNDAAYLEVDVNLTDK